MGNGIEGIAESLPGGDVKLGGKSIYLYGAAIAAVVVIYLWWSARNAPVDNTVAPDDLVPNVAGDLGDLPQAAPVTDLTDDTTTTNQYWEMQAIAWLVTQGVSPLSAQQAIERYFGGEKLDYNQTNIVNRAISHFGAPPESLLSSPNPTSNATGLVKATDHRWTNKVQHWHTIGRAAKYRSPNALTREKKGVSRVNGPVTTVQYATINGQTWVRTTAGSYYLRSALTEDAPKPKAEPKKKGKK